MISRLLSFFCFLLLGSSLFAQSQTFRIQGSVQDTLGEPLISATVLLMDMDSIMVDYSSTEADGSFTFSAVDPGEYMVKSTYVSYIPVVKELKSTGEDVNLGVLAMKELAEELMTVVIKAAKASIVMRGDTVEYDASTFKVPEGSSVEDLLRRLPGIEVQRDGSILAEGQNVDRVTVDGKQFFGADPKAATKNLPAEGISKVQVFDTKTETEEITGATGSSDSKTMNLDLKEDFKNGGFGKVSAGVGTESRSELKGNLNKFNEKIQFSIVGVGNNTGRNGLGWNDYQDFMGAQAFTFNDDTDYGFTGGNGWRYFTFGGGNGGGIESSIQNIFFNGRDQGFPENYNGGANFNFDNKKTKVSAVYFYNQANLTRRRTTKNDEFYPELERNETSIADLDDSSDGHRAELSITHKIDSFHTVQVDLNAAFIGEDNSNVGSTRLLENAILRRNTAYSNRSIVGGNLLNGTAIFRKKFRKKGRNMGVNASFLSTELDDDWTQDLNIVNFRDSSIFSDDFNRSNEDFAEKTQFKANALFVEPLSKRFFLQTFYNYSNRNENGEQAVFDIVENGKTPNTTLSSIYDNQINMNRLGSEIRYAYKGLNISTGVAYQQFGLNGETTVGTGAPIRFSDDFINWIPHMSFNYRPVRNTSINLSLTRTATEPDIEDLKAIIDYTNPNFIKVGNPTLTPEISNNVGISLRKNYIEKGITLRLRANASFLENGFSTQQDIDENLVTSFTPINIDGGQNISLNGGINFPIKMNKLTINTGIRTTFRKDPTIINGQENNTTINSVRPSITFNITPWDNFTLFIDGSYNETKSSYDLNPNLDQSNQVYSGSIELNTKLLAGFYINSEFSYDRYKNDRFDEDQTIPILNASVYRHFLEGNKLEARLSAYDAFNQNIGFSQSATSIGIRQSSTNTLARYFMFSLTYNIRGMKSDIKKNRWW